MLSKCNLSFDRAEIDYQALVNVVTYALVELRESINREMHSMYNSNDSGSMKFASANISILSSKLAKTCEVYHVLLEGQSRNNVILVNKGGDSIDKTCKCDRK